MVVFLYLRKHYYVTNLRSSQMTKRCLTDELEEAQRLKDEADRVGKIIISVDLTTDDVMDTLEELNLGDVEYSSIEEVLEDVLSEVEDVGKDAMLEELKIQLKDQLKHHLNALEFE